jgi:ComF family protein
MLSRLRQWSQFIRARLPLLLPSSCALCGACGDAALCAGCRVQFFSERVHRCACCAVALPESAGSICGTCLAHKPAYDATIVAADYAPPVDQLVLALKFGRRLELAPLLADMLRDASLRNRQVPLPSQLTAVPLGQMRLIERGFNQALEVAKPLSRSLGVPVHAGLLVRQRDTSAQSLLHPDERHRNVRNAFLVQGNAIELVRDKHVGVVDDVMTTGETLNEIAATLKRFGAARVTNFVFARTIPN